MKAPSFLWHLCCLSCTHQWILQLAPSENNKSNRSNTCFLLLTLYIYRGVWMWKDDIMDQLLRWSKAKDRNYNRLADEKKMVTLISINQICKSVVRTVEVLSQWTFGTYTYLRWLKSLWHLSEFFPSFTKSNSWTKVSFKSCRKEKNMHKTELPTF